MAYVVTEPCIRCKYTDCVRVCPANCFYEGPNSLAIHPTECIDCGACVEECPALAIFRDEEVPAKWGIYKDLNAVVTGAKPASAVNTAAWPEAVSGQLPLAQPWPKRTEVGTPMPDADSAAREEGKTDSFLLHPKE